MFVLWGCLAGLLLYLEIVFHLSIFGFTACNPIYTIGLITVWSGVGTLLVGVLRGKLKKFVLCFWIWAPIVWTSLELVYFRIFKMPVLWDAIFKGGGDALTNYWREALHGILTSLPFLLLLFLPGVVSAVILRRNNRRRFLPQFRNLEIMRTAVVIVAGIAFSIVTMQVGRLTEADFYEEYTEFYDPLTVEETLGVLPMFQRDTVTTIGRLFDSMFSSGNRQEEEPDNLPIPTDTLVVDLPQEGTEPGTEEQPPEPVEEKPVIEPHVFNLDYDKLHDLADNKKQTWLADYIQNLEPTYTNEYTGLFKDYNLIYLTAEGFSSYCVREDLTPTLYRMINTGFVFDNYYVPLWQTSTSDGEYINCMGLIPDGQFSMRKSGSNNMAFTLAKFFAKEGVTPHAYHDNSLSYYDRHNTHPNMGYDFWAAQLGKCTEAEWGNKIFPMEHPKQWPASDLEMMQGTVPMYVNEDRFHVYYLTVSGHMNYNFPGNAMSRKNKEAVTNLPMSETAQAYIACNIELDKALENLIAQLEAAGKLENTIICLSADHYPYAMEEAEYQELAGDVDNSYGLNKFRNSLILWNAGQEQKETIHIKKPCGSMDLVPTLLNLLGMEYDSRMYAGRDIFSDQEGMVIFNDRSFVTDGVIYRKKDKEIIWLQDETGQYIVPEEQRDDYLDRMKQEVKDRYQFSGYILQENYYQDILDAMLP